jgi:biotin carboxyl carrier protein
MSDDLDPPPDSHAEFPHLDERLIAAPHAGVFHPFLTHQSAMVGDIDAGETIGVLVRTGEKTPVNCPFDGVFKGLLVLPGERVRKDQPVAWLTLRSA